MSRGEGVKEEEVETEAREQAEGKSGSLEGFT